MKFQALLVLNDNSAAEVLTHVLDDYQVESEHCCDAEAAVQKIEEKRFDTILVDFDEPALATLILENLRQCASNKNAVVVGLWSDRTTVRSAFGMGANFVLYKPVSGEQACATLRAALALLKRERRRSFRVPVQMPLTISWNDAPEVEGIMLDLSEDGMDVLSAQPLIESQVAEFRFSLPSSGELNVLGQVAWANSNGQAGIQFVDLDEARRDALTGWLAANASEAPPPDPEPLTQCKLTDLSLGGCYIESESPFPPKTTIDLWLKAGTFETRVPGLVRVVHPGRGMGVEFAGQPESVRQKIEDLLNTLSSHHDVAPQLLVAPKSIAFRAEEPASTSDTGDDLLHLLRSQEDLTEDQFLAELRRQRRSESEATPA
jgi:DNA-binding response OmpR family regulator